MNVPVKKDQNGNYMVDKNGDPILEDDPAKMCPLFERLTLMPISVLPNIKIAERLDARRLWDYDFQESGKRRDRFYRYK